MQKVKYDELSIEAHKNELYIENRLRDWAQWRNKFLEQGLGYPSKTQEAKIKDDGGVLLKSTAMPVYPINPAAEEIDHWINVLSYHYPVYAAAIKIKYLELNSKKYKKPTEFYYHIRIGKMFLVSQLKRINYTREF